MNDQFAYLCLGVLFIAQGQTVLRDADAPKVLRYIGYLVTTGIGIGALWLSGVAR